MMKAVLQLLLLNMARSGDLNKLDLWDVDEDPLQEPQKDAYSGDLDPTTNHHL